jgi:hypothetical protein
MQETEIGRIKVSYQPWLKKKKKKKMFVRTCLTRKMLGVVVPTCISATVGSIK